jgi:hypothetical protein
MAEIGTKGFSALPKYCTTLMGAFFAGGTSCFTWHVTGQASGLCVLLGGGARLQQSLAGELVSTPFCSLKGFPHMLLLLLLLLLLQALWSA